MFKCRTIADLIKDKTIEPERMILSPWLPEKGIAMIAGFRGVGKTMFGIACSFAIGSGTVFLGWMAPTARRVLYVDGEMALEQVQARSCELIKGHPEFEDGVGNVFLLSHADQPTGIPNLVRYASARRDLEKLIEAHDIEVVFLDNLSALCNSDAENDVESWTVMQDWLLGLRRAGKTVVFLHHAGKPDDGGHVKQRGTSKREDILNTTILLRGDGDHGMQVIFDKHRGFEPEHNLFIDMKFAPGSCQITRKQPKGKPNMKGIAKELG